MVIFNIPENATKYTEQQIQSQGLIKAKQHLQSDEKITGHLVNGYIAKMSSETAMKIGNDSNVAFVEEDKEISIADYFIAHDDNLFGNMDKSSYKNDLFSGLDVNRFFYAKDNAKAQLETQNQAPWGVVRISNGQSLTTSTYQYPSSAGEGVDVYIIDTGIHIDHPEFHGNAEWGINLVEGSEDTDENGHGTHCAGTIGGKNVGIAKKAKLIAVKALDKNGVGKISRVLLGIDFVIRRHDKKLDELYESNRQRFLNREGVVEERTIKIEGNGIKEFLGLQSKNKKTFLQELAEFLKMEEIRPKTVVNMSIGGMKSRALEFAIDYATKIGIHFAVAAGNDHEDACMFSPGASKNVLTVGASTRDDTVAFFSNIGNCVTVFAPGVGIFSAWKDGEMKIASGTSMAAPHAAGVLALYLGVKNYSPAELRKIVLDNSFKVVENDDFDEDMLDAWPFKYLFGREIEKYKLISIKKLNESIVNEEL